MSTTTGSELPYDVCARKQLPCREWKAIHKAVGGQALFLEQQLAKLPKTWPGLVESRVRKYSVYRTYNICPTGNSELTFWEG